MATASAGEGESRSTQERRHLTLLFADLSASTNLAGSLEAEHYASLMQRLVELYRRVIPRHRGVITRIQGDGVLAVFGLNSAREDDGCRAVDAALELHGAVGGLAVELGFALRRPLSLHSGIHAGLLLLQGGDIEKGRVELLGNVPNVASRLGDAAGAGEILVTEETLGPYAERYEMAGTRRIELDFISAPLTVLSVKGHADAAGKTIPPRRPLGRASFVGREAQRSRLAAALAGVRAGRQQRLFVSGAPGVGKTRLMQTFLDGAAAAGCDVLCAACEGEAVPAPLSPFAQLVGVRLNVDMRASAEVVRQQIVTGLSAVGEGQEVLSADLHRLLSIHAAVAQGDAGGESHLVRLKTALAAFLRRLSNHATVVLFIDDWQWADDASHHLLAELLNTELPAMLVVLASRADGPSEDGFAADFEWVVVPPMSETESASAIARLLPVADPFVGERISRFAGGNPLFIEELCHRAARDPAFLSGGESPHAGSAWIESLIASRLERLGEEEMAVLRSAAIIGSTVPVWLLERIVGRDALEATLRKLQRADFLFPSEVPGQLQFKHRITRDVVFQSVGLYPRRELHARIAGVLRAVANDAGTLPDASEALAYHYGAAGDLRQAAEFAMTAGYRALAVPAIDRAQAQFRMALSAIDQFSSGDADAARWSAAIQGLGLACVFDPSSSDLPWFERALAHARAAGDANVLIRSCYWLAYIHYSLGNQRDALALGEQALSGGSGIDNRLRVQMLATYGQALAAAGRYGDALPLLEAAATTKREHRSGAHPSVGLAYTLAVKGTLLGDCARFDEAHRCFDEARDLIGTATHQVGASIEGLRAAVLLWQGRWDEATAAATRCVRIGQQVRSLFTVTMGRAAGAFGEWTASGSSAALQTLAASAEWLVPRGNRLFRSLNDGWLAEAMATLGRRDEARSYAARALVRARQLDLLGAPMACRAMAGLEARDGHAAGARRWIARADSLARQRGGVHELACNRWREAEVELTLGEKVRADDALTQARSAFAELGMRWHLEQAERLAAHR